MLSIRNLVVALCLAATTLLIPTSANAATVTPASVSVSCPTVAWGSLPKNDPTMGTGEIDNLRVGTHPCFDRVVIDIDGPPAGYTVSYVSQVTADGSGAVVPTPGGARLQVIARHPNFHGTKVGAKVANVTGFPTLRSVVYAGSFEGQTTYGVGVRARLPFRVFSIPGGHGRIVLDVAHHW